MGDTSREPTYLKQGSDFVWQRWLKAGDQNKLTRFSDGTVWLDPEDLRPGCVRAMVSPHLLLYPRYVVGHSLDVKPLSAAESVFRLTQHLVNPGSLSNGGFATVMNLARQTTAYSITYDDVAQVAAWIKQRVCFISVGFL